MDPQQKLWIWLATAIGGGVAIGAVVFALLAVFIKKAERTPEQIEIDRQAQPQTWWQWLLAIAFIVGIVVAAVLRST